MRHIYNTSFIINEAIEKQWIQFIKEHYIETLRKNKACDDIIFTKVSIDQPEGKTYSLQIVFHSEKQMNDFLENWLGKIEEKIIERYNNAYVCFSSMLTEI